MAGAMKILVDENVPLAEVYLSRYGEVERFAGRSLQAEQLAEAEALVVRSVTRVDASLLAGSRIGFVGSCTIGSDHLDLEYLQSAGIEAHTAPGCNANSVVDYVLSVIAVCGDRLERLLAGGRLGIVAYGNVGRALAARAAALGVDCIAYDPLLDQTADKCLASLEAVLQCDVVSVHAPLTRRGSHPSYHMLTAEKLRRMPQGALLISAGRGGVVATETLLALKQQRPDIRLALDVWEDEPAVDAGLAALCDVATPHIAGYSLDGKIAGTKMIAQRLGDYLRRRGDVASGQNIDAVPLATPVIVLKETGGAALLREAALAVYDPRGDDSRFRQSLLAAEPAGEFDWLRKHYPERREFAYCDYRTESALSAEALSLLAALPGSR